jgi:hypothetical protein
MMFSLRFCATTTMSVRVALSSSADVSALDADVQINPTIAKMATEP